MNHINQEKHNTKRKTYDVKDAEVMLLFLQQQINQADNAKITGMCNLQTFNLKKGILKYGN